jgi:hypothetical protein
MANVWVLAPIVLIYIIFSLKLAAIFNMRFCFRSTVDKIKQI